MDRPYLSWHNVARASPALIAALLIIVAVDYVAVLVKRRKLVRTSACPLFILPATSLLTHDCSPPDPSPYPLPATRFHIPARNHGS